MGLSEVREIPRSAVTRWSGNIDQDRHNRTKDSEADMSKLGVEWGGRGVEWGGRGNTLRGNTLRGNTLRGNTLRGNTLRGNTLR
jgi:hypothetical protein